MSMKEFAFGIHEPDHSVNVESALKFYIDRAMEINRGVGFEGFTGDETTLTCEGVKWTFPELTEEEALEVANRFNDMINQAKLQEPKRIPIEGDIIILDTSKSWVDEEVKFFMDRALKMNREHGIEGFTGNETELTLEGVKSTFSNLTDEQAQEVAQRYNNAIKIVREQNGAQALATGCTKEEVEAAGHALESEPETVLDESELQQ